MQLFAFITCFFVWLYFIDAAPDNLINCLPIHRHHRQQPLLKKKSSIQTMPWCVISLHNFFNNTQRKKAPLARGEWRVTKGLVVLSRLLVISTAFFSVFIGARFLRISFQFVIINSLIFFRLINRGSNWNEFSQFSPASSWKRIFLLLDYVNILLFVLPSSFFAFLAQSPQIPFIY